MNASEYFIELAKVLNSLDPDETDRCASIIFEYINSEKKIMTCGNGGSAFTASHYVTDWVKAPKTEKDRRLNAISLSDNTGLLTAYANDMDYENIFSEQISVYGNIGDLVVFVSGSGNSKNIINAMNVAKAAGLRTMAVVGYDGGQLKQLADFSFHVPSFNMQICEDLHLMFGHIVVNRLVK